MASKINADEFVDREGEGKPTLPKGVVLSGVTTITTATVADNEIANTTGINAGIITSTHFKGNLTGDVNAGIVTVTSQSVIGSAVTISASGIDIGAGVITATSYAGSGANLTGIGATIMVWEYNPDPYDTGVTFATGIGITFNQKIKAGSGNITLREDSASGTVVENFGIGSSVTISNNSLTIDPTSDLSEGKIYHLSYPSGVITNMAGESYVGTAYTFQAFAYNYQLFSFGMNDSGRLGLNNITKYSSPTQIPGTTWKNLEEAYTSTAGRHFVIKTDGTLWGWGTNSGGELGVNDRTTYSSPVQVGTDTNWASICAGDYTNTAIKTDGTLWVWGYNAYGGLGQNEPYSGTTVARSSPVQIPGTTWSKAATGHEGDAIATKTDGTLWSWGNNEYGELGHNNLTRYSSPTQIPGSTWGTFIEAGKRTMAVVKTDGSLWMWGSNTYGVLGQGNRTRYSSPVQVPGTTWRSLSLSYNGHTTATKTDGSLWVWGANNDGMLGLNETPTLNQNSKSSPVRMGSASNWTAAVVAGEKMGGAINSDGECWVWGQNNYGQLGQNSRTYYSSPVQIPGTSWNDISAMKESTILQTKSS